MTDINEIFTVNTLSLKKLLQSGGRAFFIPNYQRPYAWENNNIEDLLFDIASGTKQLISKRKSASFIGSLITMSIDRNTFNLENRDYIPGSTVELIDGQQRLTTLMLILTAFYDNLMLEYAKLLKEEMSKGDDRFQNLQKQILNTSQELLASLFDQQWAISNHKFGRLPKIIRHSGAEEDTWAMDNKYYSPIGTFLFQLSQHINSNPNPETYQTFKYIFPNKQENQKQCQAINEKYSFINLTINNLINHSDGSNDSFPSAKDLISSNNISSELFEQGESMFDSFLPNVNDIIRKDNATPIEKSCGRAFKLLCFTKYTHFKVIISEINSKDQDYAFDIFESLNTTGEPLNAVETFKPKVIQHMKRKKIAWKNSEEQDWFGQISGYIDNITTLSTKNRVLKDLLSFYNYSVNGNSIKNHVKDFRLFLNSTYDSAKEKRKKEFIKNLMITTKFHEYVWDGGKGNLFTDKNWLNEEEKLCVSLFRSTKHKMPNGIVLRFYEKFVDSINTSEEEKSYNNLCEVIKSSAAFYVLYRASRNSTDSIDNWYRKILKGEDKGKTLLLKGFSYQECQNDLPDPSELKKAYKNILKIHDPSSDLTNADSWSNLTSIMPIYGGTTDIAKFILLLSHNDREITNGLISDVKINESYPTFKQVHFSSKTCTVEHISPQNPKDIVNDGWDEEIYSPTQPIANSIGNLTLLKPIENSSIGNSNWKNKKWFYKLITAKSKEEQDIIKKKAEKDNVKWHKKTIELIAGTGYSHIVEGISDWNDWKKDVIIKRGRNICQVAHSELMKWLD
jgi:uncharacterized protein with ParB-like and HNH nuclease domain